MHRRVGPHLRHTSVRQRGETQLAGHRQGMEPPSMVQPNRRNLLDTGLPPVRQPPRHLSSTAINPRMRRSPQGTAPRQHPTAARAQEVTVLLPRSRTRAQRPEVALLRRRATEWRRRQEPVRWHLGPRQGTALVGTSLRLMAMGQQRQAPPSQHTEVSNAHRRVRRPMAAAGISHTELIRN